MGELDSQLLRPKLTLSWLAATIERNRSDAQSKLDSLQRTLEQQQAAASSGSSGSTSAAATAALEAELRSVRAQLVEATTQRDNEQRQRRAEADRHDQALSALSAELAKQKEAAAAATAAAAAATATPGSGASAGTQADEVAALQAQVTALQDRLVRFIVSRLALTAFGVHCALCRRRLRQLLRLRPRPRPVSSTGTLRDDWAADID